MTLLKIVLIGTVIFVPIFRYVLLLSRSEDCNLHVSGSTKARSRGTGNINKYGNNTTYSKVEEQTSSNGAACEIFYCIFIWRSVNSGHRKSSGPRLSCRDGNRSVAVPFVKDPRFHGTKIDQNVGTLSRYFDLNTLNQKLHSYSYGLLKGRRHFVQHCSQSLDVLLNAVTLEGHNALNARLSDSQRQLLKKTGWTPCFSGVHQSGNRFKGFYINQTICFDPEIITSVQQLESDVLRGSNCVGFVEWRGVGNGRCHFPLSSDKVPSPFSVRHEVPFSLKLLQAAQEFVVKQLGNSYISVHIGSEWVLREHDST